MNERRTNENKQRTKTRMRWYVTISHGGWGLNERMTNERWTNNNERTNEWERKTNDCGWSGMLSLVGRWLLIDGVDDHNQRRHAPIDLAESWKTKWWPHRQFAFFLAISEANAANSRGRAKDEQANPQLQFRKAMAMLMLENTMDDDGNIVRPVHRSLRTRAALVVEHDLKTRPVYTGKWMGNYWATTSQKYQKLRCFNGCNPQMRVRTYCSCNKSVPMCSGRHVSHMLSL